MWVHNRSMASRIVEPNEPSIEKVERQLPSLPRSEAHRIRRASRAFMDTLLPEAMKRLAEAVQSEDPKIYQWAVDKIMAKTLAAQPNEVTDPEEKTVDGSVTSVKALEELEKSTEDGSGAPDEG